MSSPFESWESFVAEARRLRRAADDAEEKLLTFLYEFETKHREVWAPAGKTFVELITEANIIKAVPRYVAWKRVREGLGEGGIAGVGTNGVVAAGSLKTAGEQKEALDRMRAHEKVNETSISEQSAERIARETKLLHIGHARSKGYAELMRENESLRAKLRAAEQTIVALRAELAASKKGKRSASNARASA